LRTWELIGLAQHHEPCTKSECHGRTPNEPASLEACHEELPHQNIAIVVVAAAAALVRRTGDELNVLATKALNDRVDTGLQGTMVGNQRRDVSEADTWLATIDAQRQVQSVSIDTERRRYWLRSAAVGRSMSHHRSSHTGRGKVRHDTQRFAHQLRSVFVRIKICHTGLVEIEIERALDIRVRERVRPM